MKRQERDELQFAKLPPAVKAYIADLEREYERVTTRQKRLRKNIVSMQRKCEMQNLKVKLAQLAGESAQRDSLSQVRRKALQRAG